MTGIASPPLAAAVARSALVADALEQAREAHVGQVRNGSGGMPYIEHPKAVATLLAEHGFGDDVLAAALLHDVVEDSETTVADLERRFGEPVAGLVAALSDDESITDYRDRKAEHRGRIRDVDGDAFAIYGADKLTNVLTLRRAYAEEGERVREEFKVPLELKLDVWDADRVLLEAEADELSFLAELRRELSLLRADLTAAAPRRGT
ncbi:MAG TPA: HD domain-containing protein [Solirubrobacterales bacterium]|nr:HD domain-containing protein [Solirubrobacterales bacterium]